MNYPLWDVLYLKFSGNGYPIIPTPITPTPITPTPITPTRFILITVYANDCCGLRVGYLTLPWSSRFCLESFQNGESFGYEWS